MNNERAIELLHRLQDEQFDGIHGDERREALSMAVRALEGDGDTISRKMAIEAIKEHRALYCDNTPDTFSKLSYAEKSRVDELDTAIATLVNLPSAQPHWIPCSERFPNDIRPVIVTWKNTDPASYYQYIVGKHFTGTACYKGGKWYWYSSTTEDMLAEYGRYDSEEFDEAIECIAWMPLPKPYGGDTK